MMAGITPPLAATAHSFHHHALRAGDVLAPAAVFASALAGLPAQAQPTPRRGGPSDSSFQKVTLNDTRASPWT